LVCLRPYSERQKELHRIIIKLYEKRSLSFKAIADKFNKLGIKTHRGETFLAPPFILFLKERNKEIYG